MTCYLKAQELDIWRVTNKGMKPRITNKEKQLDALAKSTLLSSLCVDAFDHVYSLTNKHDIWNSLTEIYAGTKDMRNKKYHVLVTKLNGIKKPPHGNANDMYSCLNIFVNEINVLGLTQIEDAQVVRRILLDLLLKYKLIISIIYDNNDLKKMTPSQVLGKITAHEMTINMGLEVSSSSGTKTFPLTSK